MTSNGKLKGKWQGYTLTDGDGKPTDAAALFLAKFGHAPRRVVKAGCVLLAGPIDGNGQRSLTVQAEAAGGQMSAETARQLAMELGGAAA